MPASAGRCRPVPAGAGAEPAERGGASGFMGVEAIFRASKLLFCRTALELAKYHGNSHLVRRIDLAITDPSRSMLSEALQQDPSDRNSVHRNSGISLSEFNQRSSVNLLDDVVAGAEAEADVDGAAAAAGGDAAAGGRPDIFALTVGALQVGKFRRAAAAFRHSHGAKLAKLLPPKTAEATLVTAREEATLITADAESAALHHAYAAMLGEVLQACLGAKVTWRSLTNACAHAVRSGRCGGARLGALRFLAAVDDFACFVELMGGKEILDEEGESRNGDEGGGKGGEGGEGGMGGTSANGDAATRTSTGAMGGKSATGHDTRDAGMGAAAHLDKAGSMVTGEQGGGGGGQPGRCGARECRRGAHARSLTFAVA